MEHFVKDIFAAPKFSYKYTYWETSRAGIAWRKVRYENSLLKQRRYYVSGVITIESYYNDKLIDTTVLTSRSHYLINHLTQKTATQNAIKKLLEIETKECEYEELM